LDVTSPLRNLLDLEKSFELLKSSSAINLFSVNNASRNPYFNMVEENEGGFYSLVKTSKDGSVLTRQTAPRVFELNASFYWYKRIFFDLEHKSAITNNSLIYFSISSIVIASAYFSNILTNTNNSFTFPTTLNNIGASILVTERATQTIKNKQYDQVVLIDSRNSSRQINIDLTNITQQRTIKFPDGNATLLSTNNVGSLAGITFGGAIAADSFGGRLRLRTHFLSAWR